MQFRSTSWILQETLAWAARVLEFDFDTVIPSHAAAPVRDGKAAFAACFPQLAAQVLQMDQHAAEELAQR